MGSPNIGQIKLSLISNVEALVLDLLTPDGSWNFSNAFKLAVLQLVEYVKAYVVSASKDRLFLTLARDGDLSFKGYSFDLLGLVMSCPSWMKDIWKKFIPHPRLVICWRLLLDC